MVVFFQFLGFGQGPRNCIGMRFALLLAKMGLVHIVKGFKVTPSPKMHKKLVIDPLSPQGMPKGGVLIKFQKRN